MNDSPQFAAPVVVTIAGRECRLAYPMHAVILYKRETAKIEAQRPHPPNPDPFCACGELRSQHTGPSLVRGGGDLPLECAGFREDAPDAGDSLFQPRSWSRIDLSSDPERWLACLWAGMHEQQSDGSWKSPFTLAQLEAAVDLGNARAISVAMTTAIVAHLPQRKESPPDPNAPAATEERAAVSRQPSALSNDEELETSSASSGPGRAGSD